MIKDILTAATIEELEAKKADYLRRYPWCGYGTSFKNPQPTGEGFSVEASRYLSCD